MAPSRTHPPRRPSRRRSLRVIWWAGAGLFEREKRYLRADGQMRWVRVKGSIVPFAGQRHTIAHVRGRDRT